MMRFEDAMPLAPTQAGEGCAVLMRRATTQWGSTCTELPIVEVDWHFPYPKPHTTALRLCEAHRAALCGREQFGRERALVASVGRLYDARVED